jgi:bacterioferritin-associated ferredoxin
MAAVPVCQLRAVFQQRTAARRCRPRAQRRAVPRRGLRGATRRGAGARIEALLGLDAADTLRYADRKKGQRRAMRLARNGDRARWKAFVLAGDTSAQAWVKTLLQEELPAQAYGRLLLVPGAKAPVAVQSRGKQVCTCFNVTGPAIDGHLAGCSGTDDERLASLQGALKCGTNCGSCVPELKRMVKAVIPLQAGRMTCKPCCPPPLIRHIAPSHQACRTITPSMGISQYIKEIGRGKQGARSLTREQAADLLGQVLDGQVTDLEIGAFCLAMRIKGETPEEMAGFLDATHARLNRSARQRQAPGGAAQLQRRAQAAGADAAAGLLLARVACRC